MDWDAFFTVHSDLPREGPGTPADVAWAIERLGLSGSVRVIDAGCGPGADMETFLELLPEASVTGIDTYFAAQAQARIARFGSRAEAVEGDMAKLSGPVDLIWCAGALYFLGVTEGLSGWRDALASGGRVAFSEPVLVGPHCEGTRAFWAEYPAITDQAGINARVDAAGYCVIDHRLIMGAPWEAYYAPMEARIAMLRAGDPSPAVIEALDTNAAEAALWRENQDKIAYSLTLVEPIDEP